MNNVTENNCNSKIESYNLKNGEFVGGDVYIDQKKNSAITLIALVITIIVLLILAGITLTFVLGENGLFGKARQAKSQTEIAQAEEDVKIRILEASLINNRAPTKEDFVIALKNANDRYSLSLVETSSLTNESIQNATGLGEGDFYVTNVDKYPNIKVKVSSDLIIKSQLASITNGTNSESISTSNSEGNQNIENILASNTPGDATASDIREGKEAWVNGEKITGTLTFGDFMNNFNKIANGEFEYNNNGTSDYIYEVNCGFKPDFVYTVILDLNSGGKADRWYDSNKSTTKCYGHYISGSNYEQTFSNSMDNGIYEITNNGFKYLYNSGCNFKITYIAIKF